MLLSLFVELSPFSGTKPFVNGLYIHRTYIRTGPFGFEHNELFHWANNMCSVLIPGFQRHRGKKVCLAEVEAHVWLSCCGVAAPTCLR